MQAIHQDSDIINYQKSKMNIQEEKNFMLYNNRSINNVPTQYFQSKEQTYYNDTMLNAARIQANQANMRIKESKMIKTKVPTYTDTSASANAGIATGMDTYGYISKNIGINGYKETYADIRTVTPITTHETLSAYVPTKENLHLSHQSLDTCNQDVMNSKETVENVCFKKNKKMQEPYKQNTTNEHLIENDSLQHNYYYDYNTLEYIDPNKEKTYWTSPAEQHINTYQNLTNTENQIYPTKSQQTISENTQQSLLDTYKKNIHVTSTQNAVTCFHKNGTHVLQNQEEKQQKTLVNMLNKHDRSKNEEEDEQEQEQEQQEEMEKEQQEEMEEEQQEEMEEEQQEEMEKEQQEEMEKEQQEEMEKEHEKNEMLEQENYRNSRRRMEYYLQQNENLCDNSQNAHEEQNNYESKIFNDDMNYQLGINEQELAALYTQYTEQNKQETLNRYESYNNTLQTYFHKPNYLNGNNVNRPISTKNINHYSGSVQHYEESYNQMEQADPYILNSTSTRTYENASAVMNTENKTNINEINNETKEDIKEQSTEFADGVMQIKTINAKEKYLNSGHSFVHQQKDIGESTQHNINQNKQYVSNTQEQYVTQHSGLYSHIPAETNGTANKQSPKNSMSALSMNSTVDLQSRFNELNNMPRMNYNSLMFQYDQHFNKKTTESALSENEYLNIHMNEQYSAKNIKEFMLEPRLLTKMDLDMPEIIDGLTTTVQGEEGAAHVKKETIMKYKDTWRLIPGKSLNINQNENTNQGDRNIQLFQQYLDRSNKKTQQMLLNSSFNSLTGRLTIHPCVNNQELDDASNTYNYKHPAAAFPNSYYQPTNSLANNQKPPNTLYPTAINEVNNEQEWKLYGTKQFISTNELKNVQGANDIKVLNKLTGADDINAINNIDSMLMNVANESHFPVDIPENTHSLLNATATTIPIPVTISEKKQQQKQRPKKRTLKKPTLPLCGNNLLTYDIKTYISQTVKNYFKGKETN